MIALKRSHADDWHDFDGDQGGGPINTIAHATGLDGTALSAEAAEFAGVTGDARQWRAPTAPQPLKRDPAQEMAHIRSGVQPLAGSAAERYLEGRGITAPSVADLHFNHDLTHWEAKAGFLAMVGLVRDETGEVVGLHRTWLSEGADGKVSKAPIPKPRMMLGRLPDATAAFLLYVVFICSFFVLSALNHAWQAIGHGNRTWQNLNRPFLSLAMVGASVPIIMSYL